jgi:hypothetical protein
MGPRLHELEHIRFFYPPLVWIFKQARFHSYLEDLTLAMFSYAT